MQKAQQEYLLTLIQKSGIVLLTLTDALVAAWMGDGEIAGFGLAALSLYMCAVIMAPHITVAASEGSDALKAGDRRRAARLFGASSVPPTLVIGVAALISVATLIPDFAFGGQATQAVDYLKWAMPAMVVGTVSRGAVKALRADGEIMPTIWSSWTLAIVNIVGDLIAAHYGYGVAGLGIATLVAECVSSPIAIYAAYRRGLIQCPSWGLVWEVTVMSRGKLVATIPELLVKAFTLKTRELMSREELAKFTLMRESLSAGDQVPAQIAKAGSNRAMRGAEGLEMALSWAWKFRAVAVIPVWVISGWQAAAALVLMEVALREYIAQRTARDYVAQAKSEGAEQVVRLVLYAALVHLNLLSANTMLSAWLVGNGVYVLVGRYYRGR